MTNIPNQEMLDDAEGLNQTDLTFQGALFETPVSTEPTPDLSASSLPAPLWRQKIWWLAGATVGLLVIGGVMASMWWSNPTVVSTEPTATPTSAEKATLDTFQLRVREASQQLKAADPAKPTTSFPLLNKELRLDEGKE